MLLNLELHILIYYIFEYGWRMSWSYIYYIKYIIYRVEAGAGMDEEDAGWSWILNLEHWS